MGSDCRNASIGFIEGDGKGCGIFLCFYVFASEAQWGVRMIQMSEKTQIHVLALISYLGIVVLACRNILAEGVLAFQDLAPMYRYEHLLRALDFPWDGKSNLGSPNMVPGNMLYSAALIVFSSLAGSVESGHKLFLLFLFTSGAVGAYQLVRTYASPSASPISSFVAGLYYVFNPWIIFQTKYGHNTILLGYAILPYALALYFSSLRKTRTFNTVSCGIVSGLLFWASFHLSYLFFALIVFHGIFRILGGEPDLPSKKRWLVVFTTIVLCSMAMALPLVSHILRVEIPAFVVRNEEAEYLSGRISPNPIDVLHTAIGALVLLAAYMHGRKRPQSVYPLVLSTIGVLLSLGGLWPLNLLYSLMFQYFPFFYIFRETSKFLVLSTVGVGLAIPQAMDLWFKTLGAKDANSASHAQQRKLFAIMRSRKSSALLMSMVIFFSLWPSFTGSYNGTLKTVQVPSHYQELDSWLRRQDGDFRVAFFPPASWASTYNWTKHWFLDPLVALQARPTVELKSELDLTRSASLTRWIYTTIYENKTQHWGRLLGILGVRYVVIREDADMPSSRKDLCSFNLSITMRLLSTERDLRLVKRIGPLSIFENPHFLQHIFSPSMISIGVGDRRLLTTLTDSNVNLAEHPMVFVDDVAFLNPKLMQSRVIFDGNRLRDLVLSNTPQWHIDLSSSLGYSSESSKSWIRGDYAWYLSKGELNIHPTNYIMTTGANRYATQFQIENSGPHAFLAQIFRSPNPKVSGVEMTIDQTARFTASSHTASRREAFQWVHLGEFNATAGRHELAVQGLGECSAISKIAIVPLHVLNEKTKQTLDKLQRSGIIYFIDDDIFTAKQSTQVFGSEYSGGSATILNSSSAMEFTWDNLRKTNWTVSFRAKAASSAGSRLTFTIGRESFIVELSETLKAYSFRVCPTPSPGITMLSVRSDGNSTFDSLTISEIANERLRETKENTEAHTDYRVLSESEYLVDRCGSLLVFLEACTDHWKLEMADRVISPSVVFGYANLYDLSWLSGTDRRGRLFYIGLRYVREGVMASMILLPLAWLSTAYFCRPLAKAGKRSRDPRSDGPVHMEV